MHGGAARCTWRRSGERPWSGTIGRGCECLLCSGVRKEGSGLGGSGRAGNTRIGSGCAIEGLPVPFNLLGIHHKHTLHLTRTSLRRCLRRVCIMQVPALPASDNCCRPPLAGGLPTQHRGGAGGHRAVQREAGRVYPGRNGSRIELAVADTGQGRASWGWVCGTNAGGAGGGSGY